MNKGNFQGIESSGARTSAGQANLTLSEIADMLDLTRERVRQIEAKALLKLRNKMRLNGIKISDVL